MMIRLKPCPFCGNPAFMWDDNGQAKCCCHTSPCFMADDLDESQPLDVWNHRPIEDALQAQIVKMRDEWKAEKEVANHLIANSRWSADMLSLQNARLHAALEVYADKSHWFPVPNGWLFTVWGSPWKTAEEALSKENEK